MLDIDSLEYIFSHLTLRNLHECRLVCHRWRLAADQLINSLKSLKIIAAASNRHNNKHFESLNCLIWSKSLMKFTNFCYLIKQFHNLKSLSIQNIDHFSDPFISVLTQSCAKLTELEFISCPGLGENKWNNFLYNTITERSWQVRILILIYLISKLNIENLTCKI